MSETINHTEVTKEDFSVEFALKSMRIGFPVIDVWMVGWAEPICIQKMPGFEATWLYPPVCVLQPGEGFTANWQTPECIQIPSDMFIANWETPECIVENTGFNVSWESPECVQTQIGISASWQTPECVQVLADQFAASWETSECIQEQVGFTTSWESPECIQDNVGLSAQWELPECIQESIGFDPQWQFPECVQSQIGFDISWESPECVQNQVGISADWESLECIQEGIGLEANWESPECIQVNSSSVIKKGDFIGGGQVYHILQSGDSGYEAGKLTALIFTDPQVSKPYGCSDSLIGTSQTDGYQNTLKLADICPGDNAATYCNNLSEGGYNDWYLPSAYELELLVNSGIGSVEQDVYFLSSSEDTLSPTNEAVAVKYTGVQDSSDPISKTSVYRVIPIRKISLYLIEDSQST